MTADEARPATWAVLALAVLLRLALFPIANNKHGDAPMRALIAERMVLEPASAAQPRTYCQFGPLHTTLMRPFIALDRDAPRSSRYLSLLAGLAVFWPFLSLARRLIGAERAPFAGLALAVSPLHLQASTTASSEALYLLLWVAALDRLLAALESGRTRTFALSGFLASLAAVTRYDAWLALPMVVVAAWVLPRRAQPAPAPGVHLRGLLAFTLAAASLPAAWLIWGQLVGGDPFFFAHYISSDHADLAATMEARYGPLVGRLRQVGVWTLSFIAAMTPVGAGLAVAAVARRPRLSPAMGIVLVAALGPPAVYVARGLATQSFEPLARFGLVPGALLLPLAATALPAARASRFSLMTVASAVAFSVVVWVAAVTAGGGRIWAGADSMGALTRLDAEDRDVAAYLRRIRPQGARVMIEPLDFAEIGIGHEAGLPWQEAVTLTITRTPRATVRDSLLSTGAQLMVGYDQPGGWPRTLPDWPHSGRRFGHWIVIGRGDLGL